MLLLGALLCACWLAVRLVPVDHGYTLPQLGTLCQSGLGQVAQVFSSRAAHDCQDVRKVVPIADPVLIAGLALLIAGAWRVLNSLGERADERSHGKVQGVGGTLYEALLCSGLS